MTASLGEKFQQNLIETVIAIDQKLYGKSSSEPTVLRKTVQIFFNLMGMALGCILVRFSNAAIANKVTSSIALLKSARKPTPLDAQSARHLECTMLALKQLKKMSARRPAILILISHPESAGAQSYLLGHLVYQAIKVSQAMAPSVKFKLVQAIDSFALDMLPWYLEGLYAGFISVSHLAMDRQPYRRTRCGKWLFKKFHYCRSIFHIERNLKNGVPVCMALSGGVLHNSRILYTIKEFAQTIFFESQNQRQPKRWFESQIVSLLSKENPCSSVTGKLSEKEKENLRLLMQESGMRENRISERLLELEEELKMATPYRLRFFNILFRRICARNVPLVLVSLSETQEGKVGLNLPTILNGYTIKNKKVRCLKPGSSSEEREQDAAECVKQFVRTSSGFTREEPTDDA